MSKRLDIIYNHLLKTKVFADIGCDHGFIANAMLENGKCQEVIISDISKKSLLKAETLLSKKFLGKFTSIECDGFSGYESCPDEVLIAGMGGEEIIKILSNSKFLPSIIALQPMKKTQSVRQFLIDNNYNLIIDYTFLDYKYYDFILAKKVDGVSNNNYSQLQLKYGRDNLANRNEDFLKFIDKKIEKVNKILDNEIKEQERENLQKLKQELGDVLNGNY